MTSSAILRSSDFCARKEFLEREWERGLLHPTELLRRAVDFGLQSEDPAQAAGDHHLELATTRGIETDSFDLLGISDHGGSLADFLVYLLRTSSPWEHPEDVPLGKETWESGAYLSESGTHLRQVWFCRNWDAKEQQRMEYSWAVGGECAVYGIPMTVFVCVIGPRREERWHSPFSKGYCHPVNGELRIRKRDGEEFGPTWGRVWRERAGFSREEWLEAMTTDGALAEHLVVHQVEVPPQAQELRRLAESRLAEAGKVAVVPAVQISQCFDKTHPCQFRSSCPRFALPSIETGFVRLP